MIEYVFVASVAGSEQEKEELLNVIKQYPDKIPGIVSLSTGFSTIKDSKFNWAAVFRFKDKEALESYGTHPFHISAIDRYGHLVKDSAMIEFEVE